MAEHTPTPWKFHQRKTWPMSIEGRVHRIVGDGDLPMAFVPSWEPENDTEIDGTAEALANADFIIKAVNSHDALVECVRELLRVYWADGDGEIPEPKCIQNARAALKIAEA